jgi:DNA-binding CsgD family transcriptional regulator
MSRHVPASGDRPARGPSRSSRPDPLVRLRAWPGCVPAASSDRALGDSGEAVAGVLEPVASARGFPTVLFPDPHPPTRPACWFTASAVPSPTDVVDPMWSLLASARLVRDPLGGVALRDDGGTEPLPGLAVDPLFGTDSAVLAEARQRLDDGAVHSSFLWPIGGRHGPQGHVRITALAATDDAPDEFTGLALTSPGANPHSLTPRELEILGLLVEGWSNSEIARALVVAKRTVAAHVEHILGKLSVPSRTAAAVRAEREGTYVPAALRRAG